MPDRKTPPAKGFVNQDTDQHRLKSQGLIQEIMGSTETWRQSFALILDSLVREMEIARCANDLLDQHRTAFFPGQSFVDPFLLMLFQRIESQAAKD